MYYDLCFKREIIFSLLGLLTCAEREILGFPVLFKKKNFIAHVITSNKTSFSSPFTGYLPAIFMGSTFNNYISYKSLLFSNMLCSTPSQGRIQDFKLGGTHLKKLRRAERGMKIFGVFRVKNQDFMPKNHIFSNFSRCPPPT
jgi:hypothetical protein